MPSDCQCSTACACDCNSKVVEKRIGNVQAIKMIEKLEKEIKILEGENKKLQKELVKASINKEEIMQELMQELKKKLKE